MPSSDAVVIVTGADGRLGRILCRQLAAAGARIAAVDRAAPAESPGLPLAADLTDEASVAAAWDAAERELGTPTALIHTVGMWNGAPLHDTALASWETMLRVNLTTAFLTFRETIRRMRDAGRGGALVGISAGQGADRGAAQQAAYSASKAGVVRLVEATAAEYRADGIAAVAVAPSTLLFGDEGPDATGVRAEDLAALCVRLAGEGAALHNGTTIRAFGSAG
jgi:NAD(P)-dependent dehydrogenase (short-subunit alcohol dehydrogenase family)